MKTQLIDAIITANTGNLFADYNNQEEIRHFLEQQSENFLRGIAQRCGVDFGSFV